MASPLFTILTLFPDALEPYLRVGVLGNALERGIAEVRLVDFRDWARDRHRTVDDRPFGGGPGMVLKPEPLADCIEWVEERSGPHRRIALDPAGPCLGQRKVGELAHEVLAGRPLMLICGRYEGFDQRLFDELDLEPLSIGDFVLSGGELPALCVVEAVTRLFPGALGDERSTEQDSFQSGPGLDHQHWTRPRVWRGREVPEVLLSGDHERIASWRKSQADERTRLRLETRGAGPSGAEGESGTTSTTENTESEPNTEPGTGET